MQNWDLTKSVMPFYPFKNKYLIQDQIKIVWSTTFFSLHNRLIFLNYRIFIKWVFFTFLISKFIYLSVFKMTTVAYVKTFWHRFQQQLLDFLFLPCTNPKQIICECCSPKSYCISQNDASWLALFPVSILTTKHSSTLYFW